MRLKQNYLFNSYLTMVRSIWRMGTNDHVSKKILVTYLLGGRAYLSYCIIARYSGWCTSTEKTCRFYGDMLWRAVLKFLDVSRWQNSSLNSNAAVEVATRPFLPRRTPISESFKGFFRSSRTFWMFKYYGSEYFRIKEKENF